MDLEIESMPAMKWTLQTLADEIQMNNDCTKISKYLIHKLFCFIAELTSEQF